jgi:hypothetical protein
MKLVEELAKASPAKPDLFWIESRGDLDERDFVESSFGGMTSRVHEWYSPTRTRARVTPRAKR